MKSKTALRYRTVYKIFEFSNYSITPDSAFFNFIKLTLLTRLNVAASFDVLRA